jgi:hypothetical protein
VYIFLISTVADCGWYPAVSAAGDRLPVEVRDDEQPGWWPVDDGVGLSRVGVPVPLDLVVE